MAVLGELITILGYDLPDQDKLKRYQAELKDIGAAILKLSAVAVAAAGGLALLARQTAKNTDAAFKFAETIGEDFEALQELGFAAEQSGSSMKSIETSLSNLNTKLGETARGEGDAARIFSLLGLNIKDANGQIKKGSAAISEIADKLKGFNEAEQIELAGKLGISQDLILLMRGGSRGIKELTTEARSLGFVLDKNAAKKTKEFNDQMNITSRVIGGIKDSIAIDLLPVITDLAEGFQDWFIANKAIIKQNIELFIRGLIFAVEKIAKIVSFFARTINKVVESLGGWKIIIITISSLIGAFFVGKVLTAITVIGFLTKAMLSAKSAAILMTLWTLAIPIAIIALKIAIGLGIAALVLFINELIVWAADGETIFGDFFDSVQALWNDFKSFISNLLSDFFDFLIPQKLIDDVSMVIDGIKLLFQQMVDFVKNLFVDLIPDLGISEALDDLKSLGGNLFKSVFGDSDNADKLGVLGGSTASPLAGNIANNSTLNNTATDNSVKLDVNVNVNGDGGDANTAKTMGTAVGNEIIKQAARSIQRANMSVVSN